MWAIRTARLALALSAVFLLGAGSAETDKDTYMAAELGVATLRNGPETPLYLPAASWYPRWLPARLPRLTN